MGKRLTLDNMDHLRDEVLEIIGRIRIPKFEVAQRIVRGSPGSGCCSGCQDNDDNNNNNINNIINTDSCYAREGEVLNDTLNAILSPSSSSSGCAGGGRSNINTAVVVLSRRNTDNNFGISVRSITNGNPNEVCGGVWRCTLQVLWSM